MTDLDALRRELAAIDQRLADLPSDAYGARIDLRARRDELRVAVRRAALSATPTEQLEEELRLLRERHAQLAARRISPGYVGAGGGPGGGGFEPLVLLELNAAIDESSGVHDVEQLIQRLEQELAARGSTA